MALTGEPTSAVVEVSGVLARVAAEQDRLRSCAVRLRGQVAGWRSPAAEAYRDRAAREAARLEACAEALGDLATALSVHAAMAEHRRQEALDLLLRARLLAENAAENTVETVSGVRR